MKKMGSKRGLRAIAVIEAVKGAIVLFVGCGLPGIMHHRTRHFVEKLVTHFHLDPAHHTPQVFLRLADNLDNANLWLLSIGAILYAGVRFAEAYGLWRARRWAEWLGCVGASMYIPIELLHLLRHPGLVSIIILTTNVIVVVYLALCLKRGVWKKPVVEDATVASGV